MPLGTQRWREILAPFGRYARSARSSSAALLHFDVESLDLNPAGWREFFLHCRETVELLYALVIIERCSFADALSAVVAYHPYARQLSAQLLAGSQMLVGTQVLAALLDQRWAGSSELPPPPPEDAPFEPPGMLTLECTATRIKESDVAMFAAFFLAFDEKSMRATFRQAMRKIYASVSSEERRRLDQHRIPVEFTLTMRQGEMVLPAAAYARSAASLLRNIAAQQSKPSAEPSDGSRWRYRFPFVLKRVGLYGIDTSTHRHPALTPRQPGFSAALAELMALGVRLHESLMFRGNTWSGRCSISEIGPVLLGLTNEALLRASLGIEQIISGTCEESLAFVANPQLSDQGHERQLQAIISALSVAHDARTINLGLSLIDDFGDKGERIMKWLVYALFSKDAASSFTKAIINFGSHAPEAAHAITSVLAAKNPARALLDPTDTTATRGRKKGSRRTESSTSATTPQSQITSRSVVAGEEEGNDDDRDLGFAIVTAGTPITVKSVDQAGGVAEIFELKQDGRFRVMRDVESSRWVDIVVPCYGHCVVARSAIDRIVYEAAEHSSLSAGYGGSITSLKFGNCKVATVLPLVKFVGPKLTSLTLGRVTSADNLREILVSCPNLNTIVLDRTEKQVETVLIKAYESGQCKIETLFIDAFWKDENTLSTDFIRTLQDPGSAVSKKLRVLTLHDYRRPTYNEEVLDAYASMLAVNRRLKFVQLCPPGHLLQPRLAALMETDGCWVPGLPLSAQKRYAFLSVVRHFSTISAPPRKRSRMTVARTDFDLGGLDSTVISLIFEFAAHGTTRKLKIKEPLSFSFQHPIQLQLSNLW